MVFACRLVHSFFRFHHVKLSVWKGCLAFEARQTRCVPLLRQSLCEISSTASFAAHAHTAKVLGVAFGTKEFAVLQRRSLAQTAVAANQKKRKKRKEKEKKKSQIPLFGSFCLFGKKVAVTKQSKATTLHISSSPCARACPRISCGRALRWCPCTRRSCSGPDTPSTAPESPLAHSEREFRNTCWTEAPETCTRNSRNKKSDTPFSTRQSPTTCR